MYRLLIHVEGLTEETFVNEILSAHLCALGYHSVGARLLGNARQRSRRGGIKPWPAVKRDIVRHLYEDVGCVASTLIDYYGMPKEGPDAWPGRLQSVAQAFALKATTVESALLDDVASSMDPEFDRRRFIPFIVMHEFEGLLFSNPDIFAESISRPDLAAKFQEILDEFTTPEEINDSPTTAPSKRVLTLMPEYVKPLHGNIAATAIGLDAISRACPHFKNWLVRLEIFRP